MFGMGVAISLDMATNQIGGGKLTALRLSLDLEAIARRDGVLLSDVIRQAGDEPAQFVRAWIKLHYFDLEDKKMKRYIARTGKTTDLTQARFDQITDAIAWIGKSKNGVIYDSKSKAKDGGIKLKIEDGKIVVRKDYLKEIDI